MTLNAVVSQRLQCFGDSVNSATPRHFAVLSLMRCLLAGRVTLGRAAYMLTLGQLQQHGALTDDDDDDEEEEDDEDEDDR